MQPPSGGCVLKQNEQIPIVDCRGQPPSGGCVLKRKRFDEIVANTGAATFGWLCVETAAKLSDAEISGGSHLRVAVC